MATKQMPIENYLEFGGLFEGLGLMTFLGWRFGVWGVLDSGYRLWGGGVGLVGISEQELKQAAQLWVGRLVMLTPPRPNRTMP